jgi:hypothetical protein
MERSSDMSAKPRKDQDRISGGGSVVHGEPDGNGNVSVQTASAVVTETLRISPHHRLPGARRNGDSEAEEKRVNLSKEEGAVHKGKKSGGKIVKGLSWALVSIIGVAIASYTQVIPEPAKLLLLGIVLVGGALWTRKQIKGVGGRKARTEY